jgi:PmbA protein
VSSRRTPVIEQGILKTYLYDRASGAREGRDSTGNGIRRPVLIEEEHEAPVRCGLRNLIIEPGSTPLAELIKGVKQGLLVKYLLGIHTANRTTGDFSNTIYAGQLIEDGEVTAVVKPGRWGLKGNFLEVLKSIESLSWERFNTGSALLPWVRTRLLVT